MQLLIGLGNPGPTYLETFHNVGFELVELLAAAASCNWIGAEADAVWCQADLEGRNVTLLKPLTFMNLSGLPVKRIADRYSLMPSEILVCYDDVALPLGTLRLRKQGGAGGHKGLASVLDALGTQDVSRLRLGIGPQERPSDLSEFVLTRFDRKERIKMNRVLERAVLATRYVLGEGMEKAMSIYNAAAS